MQLLGSNLLFILLLEIWFSTLNRIWYELLGMRYDYILLLPISILYFILAICYNFSYVFHELLIFLNIAMVKVKRIPSCIDYYLVWISSCETYLQNWILLSISLSIMYRLGFLNEYSLFELVTYSLKTCAFLRLSYAFYIKYSLFQQLPSYPEL